MVVSELARKARNALVLSSLAVGSLIATGQASAQSLETIRGTIRSLTTAPKGEVDGAVLDNSTTLHWPPHLQDTFKAVAAVGDRVEAAGQTETAPRGEVHFEVERLTNLHTGAVAANRDSTAPGPRGPRGPMDPIDRPAKDVSGVVRSLTTAPKGEVDGAILDDGTVLHWPPHLEGRFKAVAVVGDRVEAIGQTETDPGGQVRFEVERLTNRSTGASAQNDNPTSRPAHARQADRQEKIRHLQRQLSQLERELDELRREP